MQRTAAEFSALVGAFRRRQLLQTWLQSFNRAVLIAAFVLLAAAGLRLAWPQIPARLVLGAALLVFVVSTWRGVAKRSVRQSYAEVADRVLRARSLITSAVELEQAAPTMQRGAAAHHVLRQARAALPHWRIAMPNALPLPEPRTLLLQLAVAIAATALLAMRAPAVKPEAPTTADTALLATAESPVAALRETLRSSPPAAGTAANGRPDSSPTERSPGQNPDAQALAEESPSIDRKSQPGIRTGVRAAAAGGSHAGHLAAEDAAAATPSEPAEIATTGVEITREGTLRSGAGQAESSSYAAAAPVPLEGPLFLPAATLTTGTADYELSPAEHNYFERYQRYREATP